MGNLCAAENKEIKVYEKPITVKKLRVTQAFDLNMDHEEIDRY
jgi:hypothetical protein